MLKEEEEKISTKRQLIKQICYYMLTECKYCYSHQ